MDVLSEDKGVGISPSLMSHILRPVDIVWECRLGGLVQWEEIRLDR